VRKNYAYTEAETATRLKIAPSTLRNWRKVGRGPAFRRFGRSVRYLGEDIEAYVSASDAQVTAADKSTRQP
jgi:hypothetical protein